MLTLYRICISNYIESDIYTYSSKWELNIRSNFKTVDKSIIFYIQFK